MAIVSLRNATECAVRPDGEENVQEKKYTDLVKLGSAEKE